MTRILQTLVFCDCRDSATCRRCHGEKRITLEALLDSASVSSLQEIHDRLDDLLAVQTGRAQEYLTLTEVAKMHGVTRLAVHNVLHDPRRSRQIFPNAYREGRADNAVWRIPRAEAEAWQPRKTRKARPR